MRPPPASLHLSLPLLHSCHTLKPCPTPYAPLNAELMLSGRNLLKRRAEKVTTTTLAPMVESVSGRAFKVCAGAGVQAGTAWLKG